MLSSNAFALSFQWPQRYQKCLAKSYFDLSIMVSNDSSYSSRAGAYNDYIITINFVPQVTWGLPSYLFFKTSLGQL